MSPNGHGVASYANRNGEMHRVNLDMSHTMRAANSAAQNIGKKSMTNKSRFDEMRDQVNLFHHAHPEVFDLFVRFSIDRIHHGFKHYSVNAIFERIRWECDSGGNDQATFKLNNNYRAFYARRFMRMYPEYEGFFRTRKQTSVYGDATGMSELSPRDYD